MIALGIGSGWEVWEWDLSEDMKLVREIAAFIAVAIAGKHILYITQQVPTLS